MLRGGCWRLIACESMSNVTNNSPGTPSASKAGTAAGTPAEPLVHHVEQETDVDDLAAKIDSLLSEIETGKKQLEQQMADGPPSNAPTEIDPNVMMQSVQDVPAPKAVTDTPDAVDAAAIASEAQLITQLEPNTAPESPIQSHEVAAVESAPVAVEQLDVATASEIGAQLDDLLADVQTGLHAVNAELGVKEATIPSAAGPETIEEQSSAEPAMNAAIDPALGINTELDQSEIADESDQTQEAPVAALTNAAEDLTAVEPANAHADTIQSIEAPATESTEATEPVAVAVQPLDIDSLDHDLAKLTQELIDTNAPAPEKFSEPQVPDAAQTSKPEPVKVTSTKDALPPADAAAVSAAAASIAVPQATSGTFADRVSGVFGSVGRVFAILTRPALAVLGLASKPLESKPPVVRQTLGWLAINTAFLGVGLWVYLAAFRGLHPTEPKGPGFDIEHAELPAVPTAHEEHGDAGEAAAAGGHGAAAKAGAPTKRVFPGQNREKPILDRKGSAKKAASGGGGAAAKH